MTQRFVKIGNDIVDAEAITSILSDGSESSKINILGCPVLYCNLSVNDAFTMIAGKNHVNEDMLVKILTERITGINAAYVELSQKLAALQEKMDRILLDNVESLARTESEKDNVEPTKSRKFWR